MTKVDAIVYQLRTDDPAYVYVNVHSFDGGFRLLGTAYLSPQYDGPLDRIYFDDMGDAGFGWQMMFLESAYVREWVAAHPNAVSLRHVLQWLRGNQLEAELKRQTEALDA